MEWRVAIIQKYVIPLGLALSVFGSSPARGRLYSGHHMPEEIARAIPGEQIGSRGEPPDLAEGEFHLSDLTPYVAHVQR